LRTEAVAVAAVDLQVEQRGRDPTGLDVRRAVRGRTELADDPAVAQDVDGLARGVVARAEVVGGSGRGHGRYSGAFMGVSGGLGSWFFRGNAKDSISAMKMASSVPPTPAPKRTQSRKVSCQGEVRGAGSPAAGRGTSSTSNSSAGALPASAGFTGMAAGLTPV